jgi:hypothetical protein
MNKEQVSGAKLGSPNGASVAIMALVGFATGIGMRGKRTLLIVALYAALAGPSAAYAQAVDLSSEGRAAIWKSLGKNATDTQVAAGLEVGQTVPDPMRVLSFDHHLRKTVPALKSFSYALVNGQVLIVDARTRKIVAIVSK